MSLSRFISATILGLGSIVALSGATAFADTFHVSYLAPGVQASSDSTNTNTFTGFTGTTNFNGSSVTATYTGTYGVNGADIYGGAGGVGQYLGVSPGNSASIALNSSVNYFGLWISAIDQGNEISFYDDNTLLFSFTPESYYELSSICPPSYCGNPNSEFLDQNSGQMYAFFNFYDSTGSFNRIVLSETAMGVFESDNHTLANLSSDPAGIPLSPVPEPSTLVLGISGLAGLVGSRHQLMARLRRSA